MKPKDDIILNTCDHQNHHIKPIEIDIPLAFCGGIHGWATPWIKSCTQLYLYLKGSLSFQTGRQPINLQPNKGHPPSSTSSMPSKHIEPTPHPEKKPKSIKLEDQTYQASLSLQSFWWPPPFTKAPDWGANVCITAQGFEGRVAVG